MIEKIKMMPIKAYVAMCGFAQRLKDDERGSSPMVEGILLILVGVLGVALIWGWLGGWLGDLWAQITGAASGIK